MYCKCGKRLLEKNIHLKQRLEKELASFRTIVESDYRTIEGIIISSIRSVSEKLNEVIAPMNYTVQFEYKNKDEGGGHRRLVMWFQKTHEQQFRLVTERGGLSGGEHAIVSLMMMYSILSVEEEKKSILFFLFFPLHCLFVNNLPNLFNYRTKGHIFFTILQIKAIIKIFWITSLIMLNNCFNLI